jgi:glycine cleavage system H protein
MEGFSIVDIYDTKGMEYIFVIVYLLLLIVFWKVAKNPQRVYQQIREVFHTLSAKILRIPQGIYFNRNHTWTHLDKSGAAKVGLDDFLQHVVGNVRITNLKNRGESIKKGDLLAAIKQDEKVLKVYSPISGEVLDTNSTLFENPDLINTNPYDQGWIYQIKPSNWMKETQSYLLAEKATEWSKKELVRFKDFLSVGAMRKFSSEPSMVLLQDGGEIRENVLSELPDEVWEDFQEEFLN